MFLSLHIPKTAGSTFNYILKRNFSRSFLRIHTKVISKHIGWERTQPVTPVLSNDELDQILDKHQGIECISGHNIPFPNKLETSREMVFLREPVDRVLSEYFFLRKRRLSEEVPASHMKHDYRDNIHNFFNNCDYLVQKYGIHHYHKNPQTYFLDNSLDLQAAKTRLRNSFWFVGITERFDESLIVLREEFRKLDKEFNILYFSRNVVRKKDAQGNIDAKFNVDSGTINQIEEWNEMDKELYRLANDLLNEKIAAYSGDFESDLKSFQRKLSFWQSYQSLTPSLVKRFVGYLRQAV